MVYFINSSVQLVLINGLKSYDAMKNNKKNIIVINYMYKTVHDLLKVKVILH